MSVDELSYNVVFEKAKIEVLVINFATPYSELERYQTYCTFGGPPQA